MSMYINWIFLTSAVAQAFNILVTYEAHTHTAVKPLTAGGALNHASAIAFRHPTLTNYMVSAVPVFGAQIDFVAVRGNGLDFCT